MTELLPAVALAGPIYNFEGLTANSLLNVAIGEAQLNVEIIDMGVGQVTFLFSNSGPDSSSIADIYYDDPSGALAALSGIDDSDGGVSFSEGASPGNLPSGNNATPSFEADFSVDSDAPAQPNGVNPGETLGLTFDLSGSYQDLLDGLNSGLFRIGLHVQGFADGKSESFVSVPPAPAPGAILLGSAGFLLVQMLRRRRVIV